MRTFPVDDDVVALVWEQAEPAPFEQLSFNEALRRVLTKAPQVLTAQEKQLPKTKIHVPTAAELLSELEELSSDGSEPRGRAPKADLRELIRLGLLKDGQELTFVDYKGNPQPKYKATVVGADLAYQRERFSMSALSSLLLKQKGYIAKSVRGPDHWATSDGKRIRELWENVLKQRKAK